MFAFFFLLMNNEIFSGWLTDRCLTPTRLFNPCVHVFNLWFKSTFHAFVIIINYFLKFRPKSNLNTSTAVLHFSCSSLSRQSTLFLRPPNYGFYLCVPSDSPILMLFILYLLFLKSTTNEDSMCLFVNSGHLLCCYLSISIRSLLDFFLPASIIHTRK